MPTYEQLIADLTLELGEGHPALPRLPFLIRDAEAFVWRTIAPYMPRTVLEVEFADGEWEKEVPQVANILDLGRMWDEQGKELWMVPYNRLVMLLKEYGTAKRRYPDAGAVSRVERKVAICPAADGSQGPVKVWLACSMKEEPVEPGDDETTKFLLGEGYGLLKYGVLAMRIFDPEKWPAWKQQWDRELAAFQARMSEMKKERRPPEW